MKRKVLSMLLATTMLASVLTGCGSKSAQTTAESTETTAAEETATEAEPSTDTAQAATGNPVTLKTVSMFGGTDPNAPVYQSINQKLMDTYSYITIEDNSQVSDEDWKASVAADFSVGNEPDVIQFFTDANANTILATDKFVSVDEIKAEYPEYAQDTTADAMALAANPDGVQRAVPTTGYWEGLFCNKDLFDQYNVALPTDWDSLTTAIQTFNDNGVIPIACSLNNVPHYWMEFLMLYSSGSEEYTSIPAQAPEGWINGLNAFKTLRDIGAFPEDTDTVDNDYTSQLFINKQAAMQLDGSWFTGNVTDTENTVVVAFPGVEKQKAQAGSMVGGISSGFYITKKAWEDPDKRDAAVKFVEAHTCKSGVQQYWEATGAISKAAVAVDAVSDMTPLAKSAYDYSTTATETSAPTDARLGQEAYAVLISNIVKISTGASSSEDVINEALEIYAERNE